MKHQIPILLAAALSWGLAASAQRTPDHPYDFETVTADGTSCTIPWDSLYQFFDSWTPGTPPAGLSRMDDEFFISRQRPLPRITEGDYQVQPQVPSGRKMLLWTPLDDPTSTWKALPRYCFEGDNFSMWPYINCHGNWSAPWLRVSAGLSDAAAKNGVTVGCVLAVPGNAVVGLTRTDSYSQTFRKLTEKNSDGTFKNSLKLARLMKYYGINGLGVNSEFQSDQATMTQIQDFFADVHQQAEAIGWKFEVQWYDVTKDDGTPMADYGLCRFNRNMFGSGSHIVTDQLFANYNWDNYLLQSSVKCAKAWQRSSYDYYAGFDIQGRGYQNNYWQALIDNEISVGFWGAHSQSLIHQSATDDGTSDLAIQQAYLLKQELTFSGGNRNPGLLPPVRTDCSLSNADLHTFHGLARLLTAKSTIQTVPFVTRFCLGNGLKYYKEGQVAFDSKWYNLNTQDYLPTWRFWITDRNDQVTADGLHALAEADLSWDDAYTGGSCLRLHGATPFSRVKLFKTLLPTQPSYELSVVYKLEHETVSHAKLFVALKGDVTNYKEIAVPDAPQKGKWTTFTTSLGKLGLQPGDTVAMMGLMLENTDSNYQMRVGELALRNPAQAFHTVSPSIKEVKVLRGWYDRVDFKLRYASKEEKDGEKTYNDEVDTWYYEIYFQQKGEQPQLLTATESWAAYVVGAPLATDGERTCRFGVRAVSPDGQQGSEIVWSDYQDVAYDTHDVTPVVDHTVIKPGEMFRIGYRDQLMPAAQSWRIADAVTGEVVAETSHVASWETSIPHEGVYDLEVTHADGTETIMRGLVKITPVSTGAMPRIESLSASRTTVGKGEPVEYTYVARPSDGSVSRAFTVADPDMLSIPAATQQGMEYSIALWFKADKWAHDKEGTSLISKNTIADSWPYNNWGDFWVQIYPAWTDHATGQAHPAGEITFGTMGCADMDNPTDMVTSGYSVVPGVWTHLVVTQDASAMQKIYINGKRVAGPALVDGSTRREVRGLLDPRIDINAPADIHIGGGGVYKAAFSGAIDEVQVWNKALTDTEVVRSMKGYADVEVPEGLQAYYTFEEIDADGRFPNHGRLQGYAASAVRIVNGGGENTSMAAYVQQPANCHQPGYPGISGSLQVRAVPEWDFGADAGDMSVIREEGATATVAYALAGKKDVTLSLSNLWGSDVWASPGMVDVEDVESGVHPVALRSVKPGEYTVKVFSVSGVLLRVYTACVGQSQSFAMPPASGEPGLCIIQLWKDGQLRSTLKGTRP